MMLRKTLYIGIATGMLGALPAAHAACVLPPAPAKIPEGTSATEPEMISAMQTLKQYNGDVNVYIKCLEFETRQNRMSAEEQAKKHNAAISTMEKIAAKFNEQVRAFKARSG